MGWEDTGWSGQAEGEVDGGAETSPPLQTAPPLGGTAATGTAPQTPVPPFLPPSLATSARAAAAGRFGLAGWWSRALAAIIDALIVVMIGLLVALWFRSGSLVIDPMVHVLYATLLIGTGAGQTVGMRMLRIGISDVSSRSHPIGRRAH